MTLVTGWTETRLHEANVFYSPPDGWLTFTWSVSVPTAYRVRRVVAGAALAHYFRAELSPVQVVRPLTWSFRIRRLVGDPALGESRAATTVNEQAGVMYPTTLAEQGDPTAYLVTQVGNLDTVNAARIDGVVGQDDGPAEYLAAWTIGQFLNLGSWNAQGGYSLARTLRIFHEHDDA